LSNDFAADFATASSKSSGNRTQDYAGWEWVCGVLDSVLTLARKFAIVIGSQIRIKMGIGKNMFICKKNK